MCGQGAVDRHQYLVNSVSGLCLETLIHTFAVNASMLYEMMDDIGSGGAEDVGQERRKSETGGLEKLFDPILLSVDVLYDAFAVTVDVTEFTDALFWNEAGV